MRGIRREYGAPAGAKAPATPEILRDLVADARPHQEPRAAGPALLLLGFAGAFRRSELVALDWLDVAEVPEGLRITLTRSKTDQSGEGVQKAIPRGRFPETGPVRALLDWRARRECASAGLPHHGRDDRPRTRRLSDRAVTRAVQRAARRAGLDETQYAGCSLRAGLATAAAKSKGAELVDAQADRSSVHAMLERYIRLGSLFEDNAVSYTDL